MSSEKGGFSRKRVATRQLRRDDSSEGSDVDDEPTRTTFRRASDEVLATRRIIKLCRTGTASPGANPFRAACLVAPAASQEAQILPLSSDSKNGADGWSSQDARILATSSSEISDAKSRPRVVAEAESTSGSVGPVAAAPKGNISDSVGNGQDVSKPESAISEGSVDGIQGETQRSPIVKESKEDADTQPLLPRRVASGHSASGAGGACGFITPNTPLCGFASFSSSVRPAFSSTNNMFGILGAGALVGSDTHSFEPVFGRLRQSSFGSATGLSSSAPTDTNGLSIVPLQEVHVETGEEKEATVFTADATLFEYINNAWKERGRGEVKLNVSKEKACKPRLVMRSKGNLRLLLNANLFPDMKVSKMDNRGVSFACANSAAESKTGLAMYGLRLKDASVAVEFLAVVDSHKGDCPVEKTDSDIPQESRHETTETAKSESQ